MGSVKDSMKSSKPSPDGDSKNVLGGLSKYLPKKKRPQPETKAQNFGDFIESSKESVLSLITTKETELRTEKGREEYNQRALARLKTMDYHLDSIIELISEYNDDA
jgi:hypothetical protein